jgi:dTDP-4-dehydrorhamnose 3,5-epimerase-like enzyme
VNELTDHARSGSGCRIIELPKILDARGNLTFVEGHRHIPFGIARAYWLYDVPGGQLRGGHAYSQLEEFFIALSGSFDVVVDDGSGPRHFILNRSYFGLHVPQMVWRHIENFSTNAVCLILASRHYEEDDYIREHGEFLQRLRDAP